MGKVELTRKQAATIEELKTKFSNEQIVANNVKYRIAEINHDHLHHEFVKLNLDILIKALYIGYEIKEEFKVGDWVVWDDKTIGKVKKIVNDVITVDVELGYTRNNGEIAYVNTLARYFRHATPEEIAEEKERRWWAKHGRDVWELRTGDCLISNTDTHTCNVKFVESVDSETALLVDGIEDEFYEGNHDLLIMRDKYKVFCFAESRLDLQEM